VIAAAVMSVRRLRQQGEIRRLRGLPRYRLGYTNLLDHPVQFVDPATFLAECHEIFGQQVYLFVARRSDPTIIDGGANIGLATLYWKQLYPRAKIYAFEPDPDIYQALSWNCEHWRLENVILRQDALWITEGEMPFSPEGSDAGRLVCATAGHSQPTLMVSTTSLKTYLQTPVDFLKLDIEGCEIEVLKDCGDCLRGVEHLFVEYHSFIGCEQRLDVLLSILRSAGFRMHVQPQVIVPSPFTTQINHLGLDQTVSVFAWRGEKARHGSTASGDVGKGAF
jgi:FkbM family methyltransferase